jgi:hypothetical protein
MTVREANYIARALDRAWTIARKHNAPNVVISEIESAQSKLAVVRQREVCPSCHSYIACWYDHTDDCKVK